METFEVQFNRIRIEQSSNTVIVRRMPSHPELEMCELKVVGHFKNEYSVINETDMDPFPFKIHKDEECELF